ncbi:MAG: metallophosphatase family protein [Endomicrobium sp.]|nr:metallophosphatase family protein [Endomicrobium sp.]
MEVIIKILVLSDIHANVSALQCVLDSVKIYDIKLAVLLGDHIDYGMRPNETISLLREFPYPIDVNIYGNHEKAIFDNNLYNFSSERARKFSIYMKNILTNESKKYIAEKMNSKGFESKVYDGKRYLMIHGSLDDVFWECISSENASEKYRDYDYVFCGHSHLPFYFEKYFVVDNKDMRNKKKTVFINPGSVGQPRNHNPRACYCVFDTVSGATHLNNVEYDVMYEQCLYTYEVDEFYSWRLSKGV